MVQQFIQIVLTTIWIILASPISQRIGPKWWYLLGGFLAIAELIAALFFLPETKYKRSIEAFQENSDSHSENDIETASAKTQSTRLCTKKPEFDLVNFQPRTMRSDMRLWVGTPEWKKIPETLVVSLFCCPFWHD